MLVGERSSPMVIKNWRMRLLTLGCVGAALGTGGWALAHGPHGPHRWGGGGGPGFGLHRLVRHLDLTEEQEVLAVRVTRTLREDRKDMKDKHEARVREITEMLNQGTLEGARMHALVDEMAAERTAMAHRAVDAFLELEKTFTDDQRAQMREVLGRWTERMERRRP
jgi:Spy/CpxP family protein refolding chaperone